MVLEVLRTPKEQIRGQVKALRQSSNLSYRKDLARRLGFLMRAFEEDGEAWADHSPESLRQMVLFLEASPELRYPTVTVTPSATFRAQWSADPRRHLAVDFLADGQVRFVVFSPDPRHGDRMQRVSGMVSRESVMSAVGPF